MIVKVFANCVWSVKNIFYKPTTNFKCISAEVILVHYYHLYLLGDCVILLNFETCLHVHPLQYWPYKHQGELEII